MRILVTGSGGFVGGAIAARLKQDGHDVIGLGRRMTRSNRSLSRAIAADLGQPGLAARLASSPRCDAIVHAAASLDLDQHATAISLTNCLGTQQVLELASLWEVSGLVYLSSVPVIGSPLELPITELHPVSPPSAYHASKLYGEHLLALAGRDGTAMVCLRLTSPIGPGMPKDKILGVFIRRALAGEPLVVAGRGTRGQDYVDVRDIASAVQAALAQGESGLFNVASGRCISNIDLARSCVAVLQSSSEVKFSGAEDPGDGVRWEVSIAAAERTLGYRPHYSLEDSIKAVAAELRETVADD